MEKLAKIGSTLDVDWGDVGGGGLEKTDSGEGADSITSCLDVDAAPRRRFLGLL